MREEITSLASGRPENSRPINPIVAASNLFIGLAIVALLYFGREILVPVVIAALLAFILAPLVNLFRRWHAGRVGGVFAAVALVLLFLGGLGTGMTEQAAQLVGNLPQYEQTISDKIHSLQGAALRPGIFSRLSHMATDLRQEVSGTLNPRNSAAAARAARAAPAGTPAKPVSVEIQQPPSKPLETIEALGGPLLAPFARAGVVLVFVIFMLLFREDLRDRFLRLAGGRDLGRTSAAMDDAGRRLSRYFLIQMSINASFGVFIGVGLWLIGIPNPLLWGVFATLARFVPYVGAIIAAIIPAALAIAVDPGWSMLVWTLALFAVIELALGQLVEPLLYGRHTGLSPVAVIVAAAFWTSLWGPIGLLLSTPLTVCVMVLGRHVERFKFLHVLLGDQPALTPEQSFFQRMLAEDPHEVADQAEKFMKEKSLCAYYDEIAVPGLMLARLDSERGALDAGQLRRIKETVEELVEDLSDHDDTAPIAKSREDSPVDAASLSPPHDEVRETIGIALPVVAKESLKPAWSGEQPLLCMGARDALDEAAAAMLAQLLEKHGIGTRLEAPASASAANVLRLESANVALVCVVCLGEASAVQRRYLVRRLRRRLPRAQLLVAALWGSTVEGQQAGSQEKADADPTASSLRRTLEICIDAAQQEPKTPEDVLPPTEQPPIPMSQQSEHAAGV